MAFLGVFWGVGNGKTVGVRQVISASLGEILTCIFGSLYTHPHAHTHIYTYTRIGRLYRGGRGADPPDPGPRVTGPGGLPTRPFMIRN